MPGVVPVGLKCLCLVSPSWHWAREAPTNMQILLLFGFPNEKTHRHEAGGFSFSWIECADQE